jgi:3',5'-cyclic AMP phosphodiesterase CpdA
LGAEVKDLLLVQYSDPHIGSHTRGGGFIWQATGHDRGALEAFSNALGKIRRMRADRRMLCHSGDASARGAPEQLDLYATLRDSGVKLHGSGAGLVQLPRFRAGFSQLVDIPGNHDLWNGKLLNPLLHKQVRDSHWPALSAWSQHVPLTHHELVVHGLCSTSGASMREQVCAVGSFDRADLDDLEARISAAKVRARLRQVHVIVTHHSPSVGNGRRHGLSATSARVLQALCLRHDVAAVLTGHAHTYDVVNVPGFPVEVRASTALQFNLWPQKQLRQFWLHRIRDEPERLTWTAAPWIYDNRRFVEIGPIRAVFVSN